MGNGGKTAQRGFIFQTIIAIIECLERDDWDEIKLEPETELDKVDIVLYKDAEILFAMQVKSSKSFFERWEVIDWLNKLKKDAASAREVRLYLVGDYFSDACEKYILETPEVKTISFENLQNICTETLVKYIEKSGIVGDIRQDDLELLDASLFSKIHKNSIAEETVTRAAFEKAFRKAMPVHMIPLCLTSIPTVNQEVGLVGREEIVKSVRSMLEENNCTALVSGIGGIGKTAVMRHTCNDLKNEGKYVAWIESSDSLQDDLLLLRDALGISATDDANTAYRTVIEELRSRLGTKFYLFLDNLSRNLNKEEQGIINGLGIHVMVTSRIEHKYFATISLDVLEKTDIVDMFYRYYRLDQERKYKNVAWKIINSVHSHTLLVELLAKAAWEEGGTLESFYEVLLKKGFFNVSKEAVWTDHDSKERTIEACITKLYEISDLPEIQKHIMRLFTIFTPGKEIYFKVREWGDLDRQGMRRLVELGWLNRGGLENGYHIHSIIRDSLDRQMKLHGEVVRLEDYDNLFKSVKNTNSYLSGSISYELVRERIVLTEDICRYLLKRVKYWSGMFRLTGTIPVEDKGSNNVELFLGTGELLNGLSIVYCEQGYYEKALNCCDDALAICKIIESLSGMECLLTAQVYASKALLCFEQGYYENALKYYNEALAIIERLYGAESISVSALYNNISGVYLAQGNYEKAKEYIEK